MRSHTAVGSTDVAVIACAAPEPGTITIVPINSLLPPDSPRLAGENVEHTRALAESTEPFPPVWVHRPSMRVIDGMHRLRAAIMRGQADMEVWFFDGNDEDAFLLAVRANVAHGLQLSSEDRIAAAARIMCAHPQWSDRTIASVTGLSAKTVRAVRRRSGADGPHLLTRIGRDGKVYPVDNSEGRRTAGRLLADSPHASLREVARAAGISPTTVRDVRARLRRGEDPVPRRVGPPGPGHVDSSSLFVSLRNDPSLRFSESGRILLRLLGAHAIEPSRWEQLGGDVPPHCRGAVAELSRSCARAWQEFADELDRSRTSRVRGADTVVAGLPGEAR
jgi:AraC-like DNA-binding protein